ncbi:putative gluconate permease [Actinacidiphila reveromycinica]|uniref:Putative gluconate permease n=1 Tax=Actinacidiphila reveromycinica TaxID=659352 RepID=A0A7U3UR38_9ACTN|nr:gluconate:H+ symporter [Streptomyces sp. SN-593]BBA97101.1 putative gluconate permease [Streptomyces sp. SN-593]
MSSDVQHIVLAAVAVAVLVVLITKAKLHPFLALSIAALGLGFANGIGPSATVDHFESGFGDALSDVGPIIGFGTILGGILLGSGGADRIATAFIGARPVKWVPFAMTGAALLIGMPHIFDVSFVMLVPLVYATARRTGSHLLYVGLPMAAGLYISHGLLPPHPSPTAAIGAYHANTGLTLLYGLIIGIPIAVINGPLLTRVASRWFGPAPDLDKGPAPEERIEPAREGRTASFTAAMATVLLPALLMLVGTLGKSQAADGSWVHTFFEFCDNPVLSLALAVVFAYFALGTRSGFDLGQIQKMAAKGLGPAGMIILILGAGGGLSEMLTATGVGKVISTHAVHWSVSPLVLAWGVSALLRICLGSATVATVTAAGIVAPLMGAYPGLSPELLVLATASGSVMLSHVNDSGFWLFKEYYQLSVGQTFRTWTLMLSLQSLLSLGGILLLSTVVG